MTNPPTPGAREPGLPECGATLEYSHLGLSGKHRCTEPPGHKDAHMSRFSQMTWTAVAGRGAADGGDQ